MRIISRIFGESELQSYHPLDILYKINPEIASLSYADNSGVMSPEIRPLVARFREL